MYLPFVDGFVPEHEAFPAPQERPVNPFIVESRSPVAKWIYFANQEMLGFVEGDYILRLYCKLDDNATFTQLAARRIQLRRDLTPSEWMWAVDPLVIDTTFRIPQEEMRVEWWRMFI